MKLISSAGVLKIAERTLNNVDLRLAGHARRVSFLVWAVLQGLSTEYSLRDRQDAAILALLHDIGAYKTADITNLVSFESENYMAHAVYGSLFLKTFSPLSHKADIVLYHHLPAVDYSKVTPPLPQNHLSGLICLCDRLDILSLTHDADTCIKLVTKHKGRSFTEYWVDTFLQENAKHDIFHKLYTDEYHAEYDAFMEKIRLSQKEKQEYLAMLAYFIDFRSEFMVLHTITTVCVSLVLASLLELDEATINDIHFGALLHDIGKVATPVEILEKPGALTDVELEIMKRHVVLTNDILSGAIKSKICKIASRHHEKIDGSGYPDGLCGKDLSQNERIVAVADIMSALIGRRSYKNAFGQTEAISILTEMVRANKLCPKVVGVVVDNFDYILSETRARSEVMVDRYTHLKDEYTHTMRLIDKWGVQ